MTFGWIYPENFSATVLCIGRIPSTITGTIPCRTNTTTAPAAQPVVLSIIQSYSITASNRFAVTAVGQIQHECLTDAWSPVVARHFATRTPSKFASVNVAVDSTPTAHPLITFSVASQCYKVTGSNVVRTSISVFVIIVLTIIISVTKPTFLDASTIGTLINLPYWSEQLTWVSQDEVL